MSNGQDFITTSQLHRHIQRKRRGDGVRSSDMVAEEIFPESQATDQVDDHSAEQGDNLAAGSAEGEDVSDWPDAEKLTEDHLVSAAVSYSSGQLPVVHRVLEDVAGTGRTQRDWESMSFVERSVWHPWQTAGSVYGGIVMLLAQKGALFLKALVPAFSIHLQTLAILILYSAFNLETLFIIVPLMAYYGSLAAMVVSTFQLLRWRQELSEFRLWSNLFRGFSTELDTSEPEWRYHLTGIGFYMRFFSALVVHLVATPLVPSAWTPGPEIAVVGLFLAAVTLFMLPDRFHMLTQISFVLAIIARSPYESETLSSSVYPFSLIQSSIPVPFVGMADFTLCSRSIALLSVIPCLVRLAVVDRWQGTLRLLAPLLVSLGWMGLGTSCLVTASWTGLLRGGILLAVVLLCLPLAGVLLLLLPVFALGRYLASIGLLLQVSVTVVLVCIPLAASRFLGGARRSLFGRFWTVIQVACGIVALLSLIPNLQSVTLWDDGSGREAVPLTWEQFRNFCGQPAWEERTEAQTQLDCWKLKGLPIRWEGQISSVRVRKLDNPIQGLFSLLPTPLNSLLTCFYGSRDRTECHSRTMSETEYKFCKVLRSVKSHQCHLGPYSRYEFEITVKMKTGRMWAGSVGNVFLVAEHSFHNFTLALNAGDHVWFSGKLNKDLGGQRPEIFLDEIGCLTCATPGIKSQRRINVISVSREISLGLKSLFNFIFSPLVQIR